MRVAISFLANDMGDVEHVVAQLAPKIEHQLVRPQALCKHEEAEDQLRDRNGNVCGTIKVTKDTE